MIPSETDAYKYALSMELRADSFRYAFINPETNDVVHDHSVNFDALNEKVLTDLLDEPFLKYDYRSVLAVVSTPRHTLVPNAVFNVSTPKEIFELNHLKPIDNLDYRRLPELGLISIYEIPLWIKSVLVKRFLKIKINHHSTVLLKGVFSKTEFKPKAYIYKESNLFYIILTDKNKLVYFNLFESGEIADLVYYYLFMLEQKGYDADNVALTVFGLDEDHPDLATLKSLLSSPVKLPVPKEQRGQFILTNQLLCV